MDEKRFAKVMPPYIDAYNVDYEEQSTFSDFEEMVRNHADDWGIQGTTHLLLRGESAFYEDDPNKIIVGIGYWGSQTFIAHVAPAKDIYDPVSWWERVVVEPFDFPYEWDVT